MNYGKLCLQYVFVLTFVVLLLSLAVSAESQETGNGKAVMDAPMDIAKYIKAAQQGGAEEQYKLARIYQEGQGIAKDNKAAAKWFRKAADHGHTPSQWRLGLMYRSGEGVAKDEKEAIKWLRRAAEKGYDEAQASLGGVLILGNKDDAEALKWIRRSAEQNLARGQFLLAWMYLNGRGVAKDEGEALKWLRASALQGFERSRTTAADIFNYDALDDDRPVSYEEHLKEHSLQVMLRRNYAASGDGKRLVLPLAKNGAQRDFVGMSLWEYNSAKGTFVKHPFRFLHKSKIALPVAISQDGTIMAYEDSGNKTIVLVDLDINRILRKIKYVTSVFHIAISRDNETLAVHCKNHNKSNILTTYSVKQGTQRGQTDLPNEATVSSMFFDADGNLIVAYFIWRDSSYNKLDNFLRVYNDNLQSRQRVDNYTLVGINPDGNRLVLSNIDDSDENSKTRLYNLRSREWEKTSMPLVGTRISYGSVDRFLTNSLEEYTLSGDKALFLQDGPTHSFSELGPAPYVAAAQSWFLFIKDRIITMRPAPEVVVRAMKVLWDGEELLQAGFHQAGAAKVKEAMAIYPTADRLNNTVFYVELVDKNVPLRYVGELLLNLYDKHLGNETGSQREKITKAVERLRDYGLFAANAGHPDLALQAAQRIRFLQASYPDVAPWDQLLKNAVVLEALQIAAKQSPADAYEYILSQGGILHDDYPAVKESINHWRIDSYWSLLYSDLNKLAYLLKRDVAKLKKPKSLSCSPQPYPDLRGKLVEADFIPPRLEKAPPVSTSVAPAKGAHQAKGRVLD